MTRDNTIKLLIISSILIISLLNTSILCTAQINDSIVNIHGKKLVDSNRIGKLKRMNGIFLGDKDQTRIYFYTNSWRLCRGLYECVVFYDDDNIPNVSVSRLTRIRRHTEMVHDTTFAVPNFSVSDFIREFKQLISLDFSQSKDGFMDGDRYIINVDQGGVDIKISVHCAESRLSDPNVKKFWDLYQKLEKLANITD